MTEDSSYEREKIAEILGYYDFETIQDHAEQNGVDSDDFFIRLMFNKINEYEDRLSAIKSHINSI